MMLPELRKEIGELLDGKVVECTSGLEHDYGTCAAGCKDGYVADPAYDGLREVVREIEPCDHVCCSNCVTGPNCEADPDSYSTRSWEGMPKGALAGALFHAWGDNPHLVEVACRAAGESYAHVRVIRDRWFVAFVGEIITDSPDPDLAAATALFEALKG